jgi:hypothetical protein
VWGSIGEYRPYRQSDIRPIPIVGDFAEEKINAPPRAIIIRGEGVFCPERDCGRELHTRKADGLMFCVDCGWNFQEKLLSEKRQYYAEPE